MAARCRGNEGLGRSLHRNATQAADAKKAEPRSAQVPPNYNPSLG